MATDGNTATHPGGEIMKFVKDAKGRNRHERLVNYGCDLLHLKTSDEARDWWKSKRKWKKKAMEVYVVPMDKEIQKLIDDLAEMVESIDEWIDKRCEE